MELVEKRLEIFAFASSITRFHGGVRTLLPICLIQVPHEIFHHSIPPNDGDVPERIAAGEARRPHGANVIEPKVTVSGACGLPLYLEWHSVVIPLEHHPSQS